jgi:hypothetical protein
MNLSRENLDEWNHPGKIMIGFTPNALNHFSNHSAHSILSFRVQSFSNFVSFLLLFFWFLFAQTPGRFFILLIFL